MNNYYIYEIKNNLNGKTYIGQHKSSKGKDNYMGSGTLLHKAYDKYGVENFTKTILCYAGTKEQIDDLEKKYIKDYRDIGKAEYNLTDGGEGTEGYIHTEETKLDLHNKTVARLKEEYAPIYELRLERSKGKLWAKIENSHLTEEQKDSFYKQIYEPRTEQLYRGRLHEIEESFQNLELEMMEECMHASYLR